MEEKIMARVRGLLAKAESTEFAEEAEAYTAKAADLIAKYGIDQAMLAAAGKTRDEIGHRKITFDNPYARDKAYLLHCVAKPLRCRSIRFTGGYARLVGFASDLERVELLYTSLLLQATRQLVHIRPDDTAFGTGESTTSYRKSWLSGFSMAVLDRLTAAEERAAVQADAGTATTVGTPGTALVLKDRSAQVDHVFKGLYPNIRNTTRRLSGSGYGDGQAAGQRADLGNGRVSGRKEAIGR